MLQRTFLTAVELGIEDWEREGLIKFLGMAERGELVHHAFVDIQSKGSWMIPNGFNMRTAGVHCGTTACIGGWVFALAGEKQPYYDQFQYVGARSVRSSSLSSLYFDYCTESDPTPGQAAEACRSFLSGDKEPWRSAQ